MPIEQLNTHSLGSVVGQRSEGQVLADSQRTEGQAMTSDQLNAANLVPIDQLNAADHGPIDQHNSLSLGNFVGQRPGGQMSADEQSESNRRRRAASQPCDRVVTPTDNQPHTRLVTVDVHEHPSSRGASVNFNRQQPRQSNNFSDVEGESSEDTDPGYEHVN